MPQTLRKIDYFYAITANTAGEGLRILSRLREEGVGLLAYSGFPSGRKAQLDFVPADPAQLKVAAKKMKLKLSAKKTCFLLEGDDKHGALIDILSTLAKAKINITAMDAVIAGQDRFGAIFWVKPKDTAKAAKLLGAT
jgi:hypothetical protein